MKLHTQNESTMILWIASSPWSQAKDLIYYISKAKKGWDCAHPWCSCWQSMILFPYILWKPYFSNQGEGWRETVSTAKCPNNSFFTKPSAWVCSGQLDVLLSKMQTWPVYSQKYKPPKAWQSLQNESVLESEYRAWSKLWGFMQYITQWNCLFPSPFQLERTLGQSDKATLGGFPLYGACLFNYL